MDSFLNSLSKRAARVRTQLDAHRQQHNQQQQQQQQQQQHHGGGGTNSGGTSGTSSAHALSPLGAVRQAVSTPGTSESTLAISHDMSPSASHHQLLSSFAVTDSDHHHPRHPHSSSMNNLTGLSAAAAAAAAGSSPLSQPLPTDSSGIPGLSPKLHAATTLATIHQRAASPTLVTLPPPAAVPDADHEKPHHSLVSNSSISRILARRHHHHQQQKQQPEKPEKSHKQTPSNAAGSVSGSISSTTSSSDHTRSQAQHQHHHGSISIPSSSTRPALVSAGISTHSLTSTSTSATTPMSMIPPTTPTSSSASHGQQQQQQQQQQQSNLGFAATISRALPLAFQQQPSAAAMDRFGGDRRTIRTIFDARTKPMARASALVSYSESPTTNEADISKLYSEYPDVIFAMLNDSFIECSGIYGGINSGGGGGGGSGGNDSLMGSKDALALLRPFSVIVRRLMIHSPTSLMAGGNVRQLAWMFTTQLDSAANPVIRLHALRLLIHFINVGFMIKHLQITATGLNTANDSEQFTGDESTSVTQTSSEIMSPTQSTFSNGKSTSAFPSIDAALAPFILLFAKAFPLTAFVTQNDTSIDEHNNSSNSSNNSSSNNNYYEIHAEIGQHMFSLGEHIKLAAVDHLPLFRAMLQNTAQLAYMSAASDGCVPAGLVICNDPDELLFTMTNSPSKHSKTTQQQQQQQQQPQQQPQQHKWAWWFTPSATASMLARDWIELGNSSDGATVSDLAKAALQGMVDLAQKHYFVHLFPASNLSQQPVTPSTPSTPSSGLGLGLVPTDDKNTPKTTEHHSTAASTALPSSMFEQCPLPILRAFITFLLQNSTHIGHSMEQQDSLLAVNQQSSFTSGQPSATVSAPSNSSRPHRRSLSTTADTLLRTVSPAAIDDKSAQSTPGLFTRPSAAPSDPSSAEPGTQSASVVRWWSVIQDLFACNSTAAAHVDTALQQAFALHIYDNDAAEIVRGAVALMRLWMCSSDVRDRPQQFRPAPLDIYMTGNSSSSPPNPASSRFGQHQHQQNPYQQQQQQQQPSPSLAGVLASIPSTGNNSSVSPLVSRSSPALSRRVRNASTAVTEHEIHTASSSVVDGADNGLTSPSSPAAVGQRRRNAGGGGHARHASYDIFELSNQSAESSASPATLITRAANHMLATNDAVRKYINLVRQMILQHVSFTSSLDSTPDAFITVKDAVLLLKHLIVASPISSMDDSVKMFIVSTLVEALETTLPTTPPPSNSDQQRSNLLCGLFDAALVTISLTWSSLSGSHSLAYTSLLSKFKAACTEAVRTEPLVIDVWRDVCMSLTVDMALHSFSVDLCRFAEKKQIMLGRTRRPQKQKQQTVQPLQQQSMLSVTKQNTRRHHHHQSRQRKNSQLPTSDTSASITTSVSAQLTHSTDRAENTAESPSCKVLDKVRFMGRRRSMSNIVLSSGGAANRMSPLLPESDSQSGRSGPSRIGLTPVADNDMSTLQVAAAATAVPAPQIDEDAKDVTLLASKSSTSLASVRSIPSAQQQHQHQQQSQQPQQPQQPQQQQSGSSKKNKFMRWQSSSSLGQSSHGASPPLQASSPRFAAVLGSSGIPALPAATPVSTNVSLVSGSASASHEPTPHQRSSHSSHASHSSRRDSGDDAVRFETLIHLWKTMLAHEDPLVLLLSMISAVTMNSATTTKDAGGGESVRSPTSPKLSHVASLMPAVPSVAVNGVGLFAAGESTSEDTRGSRIALSPTDIVRAWDCAVSLVVSLEKGAQRASLIVVDADDNTTLDADELHARVLRCLGDIWHTLHFINARKPPSQLLHGSTSSVSSPPQQPQQPQQPHITSSPSISSSSPAVHVSPRGSQQQHGGVSQSGSASVNPLNLWRFAPIFMRVFETDNGDETSLLSRLAAFEMTCHMVCRVHTRPVPEDILAGFYSYILRILSVASKHIPSTAAADDIDDCYLAELSAVMRSNVLGFDLPGSRILVLPMVYAIRAVLSNHHMHTTGIGAVAAAALYSLVGHIGGAVLPGDVPLFVNGAAHLQQATSSVTVQQMTAFELRAFVLDMLVDVLSRHQTRWFELVTVIPPLSSVPQPTGTELSSTAGESNDNSGSDSSDDSTECNLLETDIRVSMSHIHAADAHRLLLRTVGLMLTDLLLVCGQHDKRSGSIPVDVAEQTRSAAVLLLSRLYYDEGAEAQQADVLECQRLPTLLASLSAIEGRIGHSVSTSHPNCDCCKAAALFSSSEGSTGWRTVSEWSAMCVLQIIDAIVNDHAMRTQLCNTGVIQSIVDHMIASLEERLVAMAGPLAEAVLPAAATHKDRSKHQRRLTPSAVDACDLPIASLTRASIMAATRCVVIMMSLLQDITLSFPTGFPDFNADDAEGDGAGPIRSRSASPRATCVNTAADMLLSLDQHHAIKSKQSFLPVLDRVTNVLRTAIGLIPEPTSSTSALDTTKKATSDTAATAVPGGGDFAQWWPSLSVPAETSWPALDTNTTITIGQTPQQSQRPQAMDHRTLSMDSSEGYRRCTRPSFELVPVHATSTSQSSISALELRPIASAQSQLAPMNEHVVSANDFMRSPSPVLSIASGSTASAVAAISSMGSSSSLEPVSIGQVLATAPAANQPFSATATTTSTDSAEQASISSGAAEQHSAPSDSLSTHTIDAVMVATAEVPSNTATTGSSAASHLTTGSSGSNVTGASNQTSLLGGAPRAGRVQGCIRCSRTTVIQAIHQVQAAAQAAMCTILLRYGDKLPPSAQPRDFSCLYMEPPVDAVSRLTVPGVAVGHDASLQQSSSGASLGSSRDGSSEGGVTDYGDQVFFFMFGDSTIISMQAVRELPPHLQQQYGELLQKDVSTSSLSKEPMTAMEFRETTAVRIVTRSPAGKHAWTTRLPLSLPGELSALVARLSSKAANSSGDIPQHQQHNSILLNTSALREKQQLAVRPAVKIDRTSAAAGTADDQAKSVDASNAGGFSWMSLRIECPRSADADPTTGLNPPQTQTLARVQTFQKHVAAMAKVNSTIRKRHMLESVNDDYDDEYGSTGRVASTPTIGGPSGDGKSSVVQSAAALAELLIPDNVARRRRMMHMFLTQLGLLSLWSTVSAYHRTMWLSSSSDIHSSNQSQHHHQHSRHHSKAGSAGVSILSGGSYESTGTGASFSSTVTPITIQEKGLASDHLKVLEFSQGLMRDIRSIDVVPSRDPIKAALLYVSPHYRAQAASTLSTTAMATAATATAGNGNGSLALAYAQACESAILGTTVSETSPAFRQFVSKLGWDVDLATHEGYLGRLQPGEACDGDTALYYANTRYEVIYHDATRMPNDPRDPRHVKKKRHVGNDHVHIVWNETTSYTGSTNNDDYEESPTGEYHTDTISGDFGSVIFVLRPLPHGRVAVTAHASHVLSGGGSSFGPLNATAPKTTMHVFEQYLAQCNQSTSTSHFSADSAFHTADADSSAHPAQPLPLQQYCGLFGFSTAGAATIVMTMDAAAVLVRTSIVYAYRRSLQMRMDVTLLPPQVQRARDLVQIGQRHSTGKVLTPAMIYPRAPQQQQQQ